jgi:hypothetical protein
MFGYKQNFTRIFFAGVMLLISGCAEVIINAPHDGALLNSTTNTFNARKIDGACAYKNGSFQVVIDKGKTTQTDISSSFARVGDTDEWIANNVTLPVGLHTMTALAQFTGSICGGGKTVSENHHFEIRTPK